MKEEHLKTVVEVLQGVRGNEVGGLLERVFGSEGGGEACDVLMKYL